MKCPKCGYISFEYLDDCKKCSKDLTRHKKTYDIAEEKQGFINILKFIELEISTDEDFGEKQAQPPEEKGIEGPVFEGEDFQTDQQELNALAEIETDFVTTKDGSPLETIETSADLSDSPPVEEIQLDEVSLSLDDIQEPQELDEKPEELEEVEILLDSQVAGSVSDTETPGKDSQEIEAEDEKSNEIEFSLEEVDLDDKTLYAQEPADIVPDLTEQTDQTVTEAPDGSVKAYEESEPTPDSREEPEIEISFDDEQKEFIPETALGEPGEDIDFSSEEAKLASEIKEQPPGHSGAEEKDLELSLDEFDNFDIAAEDLDFTDTFVSQPKVPDENSLNLPSKSDKESPKKSDRKNTDDTTLDIDLDDLYPDQ